MEIVLVLVSVVISTGIAYALRAMDRDSNQMEKVKIFANNRQLQFDRYFDERSNALRADSAELETKFSQATAIIKRLDLQMEDFQEKLAGVQKDKNAALEVEKKVAEYGRAINELAQMTEAVEENLKRVRQESVIVDKVWSGIKNNQDTLEKLSKRIPNVVSDFEKVNAEQVKKLGAETLQKIDARIADVQEKVFDLEESAKDAIKQNEKIQKDIENSVSGIYASAAEKVKALEDDAFKVLREESNKRTAEYNAEARKVGQQMVNQFDADMNKQVASVREAFEKELAETKSMSDASVKEAKFQVEHLIVEAKAQSETLIEKIQNSISEFQISTDKSIGGMRNSFNAAVAEIRETAKKSLEETREQTKNSILEIQDSTKKTLADARLQTETSIAGIKKSVDASVSEIKNSTGKSLEETRVKAKASVSEIQNFVNASTVQMRELTSKSISEVNEKLNAALSETRKTADDLAKETSGNGKSLDSVREQLQIQVEQLQEKYDAAYANMFKQIEEKEKDAYEKYNDAYKVKIENYKTAVNEKIETYKASIFEKALALQNSIKKSIDDLKAQSAAVTSETKTQISELKAENASALEEANESRKRIEEWNATLDQTMTKFEKEAAARLDDISRRLETAVKNAITSYDSRQITAMSELDADLEKYKKDMLYRFSRLETSGDDVDGLEKVLRKSMGETQRNVIDSFKTFADAQKKQQLDFQNQIKESADALTGEIQEIESAMEELRKQTLARTSEKLSGFENSFEVDLKKRGDEMDESLNSWRQGFENKISEIQSNYEKGRLEIEEKYNEEVKARLAAVEKKSEEQIRRTATNIQASYNEIKGQTETIRNALKEFKTEYQTEIRDSLRESDKAWQEQTEKYSKEISVRLAGVKEEILADIEKFKQDSETQRQVSAATIDTTLQDFNSWKIKIDEQIEASNKRLDEEIEDFKKTYSAKTQAAQSGLDEEIENMKSSVEIRRREILDTVEDFRSNVISHQQEIIDSVDGFKDSVLDRHKEIEERVEELNSRTENSLVDYEKKSDSILANLQDMFKKMEDKSESISSGLQANGEKILINAENRLRAQSEDAEKKVKSFGMELDALKKTSLGEYKNRTDSILSEMRDTYTDILSATENRLRKQSDDLEKRLGELNDDLEAANTNAYKRNAQIQDDSNNLQSTLRDLEAELSDIKTQLGTYDRADELKRQFDVRIKQIEDSFSRLDDFQKKAESCNRDYEKLVRLDEQASARLEEFKTSKAQIDDLVRDYSHIVKLSETVGQKIKNLEDTNDELQNLEIKVRKFKDDISSLSVKYDRVDKKSETIDRVATDVDNAFENLKELEQRLEKCASQVQSLPEEIRGAQDDVDKLLDNTKRINVAADKLDSLGKIIEETEEKIEKIQRAREGIVNSEDRLNKLAKEIDMKFSALEEISQVKNEEPKATARRTSSMTPRKKSSVKELKRQGWRIEDIATALKMTETEVQLILDMPE